MAEADDPLVVDSLKRKPRTEAGEGLGSELTDRIDEASEGIVLSAKGLLDAIHHVITEEHAANVISIINSEEA